MLSLLKRATWKIGILTMLLSLLGFTIALAASGDLDVTFSGDGKQFTDFAGGWNDGIRGMALQTNGRIVAVGDRSDPANSNTTSHDFALARYLTNGNLDTSFSADGKQLTDFGGVDRAWDVAIQSNGKIVVSGTSCTTASICDVIVARYASSGTLDTTFSGDGKQVIDFGSGNNETHGGLAIQSDGKIVVAGDMLNASGNADFAVFRLNSNGSFDTGFSGDGKASFGFGAGKQDTSYDLVLSVDKIVVGGRTCNATWASCNFALARLNSDGTLDATFSGDGKQTSDFGASDGILALARQSDGKIIAVGERYAATSNRYAVTRYGTDGILDVTFSGDGKQTVNMGTYAWGSDVVVQGDGKIAIAGLSDNGADDDFALVRLTSDGNLDPTFSGDGKVAGDFYADNDIAHALVLQTDGKYVVGGYVYKGTSNFGLARVLP
jgi:uncharacterized delta-60 repeat protein